MRILRIHSGIGWGLAILCIALAVTLFKAGVVHEMLLVLCGFLGGVGVVYMALDLEISKPKYKALREFEITEQ